ncbi:MAG TPA: methionine synthase, partial [Oscillospiraceae bacterium]|nr:methionine synthase [Oscillospiraceae bacterium]
MKKIIGLTLGNCVHVAGTMNYLNLAEKENYKTEFAGIGINIEELIKIIEDKKPDIVGLSYRLSPE